MRFGNQKAPICVGEPGKLSDSLSHEAAPEYDVPVWKRALDITCIVVSLPVVIPIFVLLALGIKCVSPGPVLFLSERVGYRGRRFICFKFRTMKVDADCDAHRRHLADLMRSDAPMVKMDAKGDPRLIPLGKILRASGLDELPQLLNVLGGEMSLVGPRPCLPYEFENYLPEQRRRFSTLPGLTGLWQVSGKNKTTFSEMISFDIDYARKKSLWLDLKIMLKTAPAILIQIKEARARRKEAARPQQQRAVAPRRINTLEPAQPELVSSK